MLKLSIPDPIFKAALVGTPGTQVIVTLFNSSSQVIDTNGDGQIQVSEALQVKTIQVFDNPQNIIAIGSLQGVEAFANLEDLRISGISIPSLQLSGPANLKKITSVNCSTLSFDFSGCINLESLVFEQNYQMQTLNLTGLSNLKVLDFTNAENLQALDLTGLTNLQDLYLAGMGITSIDLTPATALKHFLLEITPLLTTIDFSTCANLEYIELVATQLNVVNFGYLPSLNEFRCDGGSSLIELDFSGCVNLAKLYCDATSVKSLNLKNGKTTYTAIYVGPNQLEYVCVDEGEAYFDEFVLGYPQVALNTYCTPTPGGSYNVYKGTVRLDSNGDGCNSNDPVFRNVKLKTQTPLGDVYTFTNSLGEYKGYAATGNYVTTPILENNWFTTSPGTANANFAIMNNSTITNNFCIIPSATINDAEIVIVPLLQARPGFNAKYKLVCKNKGNQVLSGTIVLEFQDDLIDFISSSQQPSLIQNNQLTFNYVDLLPYQNREIEITFNINSPMETPAVNIGDILNFTAIVTPLQGDQTTYDNTFSIKQVVVGSFDPNDITCLEGPLVSFDNIGGYLHYNINFENTGTAAAEFIVVKDVIDALQFDINTIEVLGSSHGMTARITGNKVEFRFDDINLGPQGKGNVVFKIKTQNTLQIGEEVTQKAEIFFDYNWPIETNEATTVFDFLSRGDFAEDNSVQVYPNPTTGIVNIKVDSNITSLELYDVQGRLLQTSVSGSIDISQRAQGIYFLKIKTDKGMSVQKIVRK